MTTYRILKAEGKAPLAIAKEFNWPAALLAPLWAAYKGFWPGALIFAAGNIFLRFIVKTLETGTSYFPVIGFVCLFIGWTFLIGKYANLLLTAYKTSKGYKLVDLLEAVNEDAALEIADGKLGKLGANNMLSGSSSDIEKTESADTGTRK